MRRETTRSLLIGLFVLTGRAELSAAELVRLARCRGASAGNVKSHLTRMVQDGSLVRSGSPRLYLYAPAPGRKRIIEAIEMRIQPSEEAWNGDWILFAAPLLDARARRRLRFDGFRPVGRGAFARPAWPRTWALERARTHAERSGGGFVVGSLNGERVLASCLRAYGLGTLARRAARLGTRIARGLSAPPTGARAFALRLEIGEAIARLFSANPRLPSALWGGRDPLHDVARAYARLERVLARAGAPFLAATIAAPPRRGASNSA